jgi:hypothetical protein
VRRGVLPGGVPAGGGGLRARSGSAGRPRGRRPGRRGAVLFWALSGGFGMRPAARVVCPVGAAWRGWWVGGRWGRGGPRVWSLALPTSCGDLAGGLPPCLASLLAGRCPGWSPASGRRPRGIRAGGGEDAAWRTQRGRRAGARRRVGSLRRGGRAGAIIPWKAGGRSGLTTFTCRLPAREAPRRRGTPRGAALVAASPSPGEPAVGCVYGAGPPSVAL